MSNSTYKSALNFQLLKFLDQVKHFANSIRFFSNVEPWQNEAAAKEKNGILFDEIERFASETRVFHSPAGDKANTF